MISYVLALESIIEEDTKIIELLTEALCSEMDLVTKAQRVMIYQIKEIKELKNEIS